MIVVWCHVMHSFMQLLLNWPTALISGQFANQMKADILG